MIPFETVSRAMAALSPAERDLFARLRPAEIAAVLADDRSQYAGSADEAVEALARAHLRRRGEREAAVGDAWLALSVPDAIPSPDAETTLVSAEDADAAWWLERSVGQ